MDLGEILRENRGASPAIIFGREIHTYADLDDLANRFAQYFSRIGMQVGDRVSFIAANDPLLIAAYFGAFRLGVIANPLNYRLTPPEVAYILNHAGSRCVVVSGEFVDVLAKTLPLLKVQPHVLVLRADARPPYPAHLEDELRAAPAVAPRSRSPAADDGALLLYTSGTTGHPKGVLLTHANLMAGAQIVHRAFEITASQRTLCVMPISHTNGLMFSHMPFLLGRASVVLRSRFSASDFWALCSQYEVTNSSVSPTILAILLERADNAPKRGNIKLDYIKVASAPLPVDLAEHFERRFGSGLLLETFGLTETTAISTMNPLSGPRKFGSIGKALAPQEVRVVNDLGLPLPTGQIGELEIRGPTVMKEYFRDPENTRKTLHEGWLRSGDIAYQDEDGYFFIAGRKKEMILRGGENISPLEIEAAAGRHPAVREAAAVGIPDRIWGEIVGLCVVPKSALDEHELREYCRSQLSDYKVPERIAFVDELPRNAMGKITRAMLRAVFTPSTPRPSLTNR